MTLPGEEYRAESSASLYRGQGAGTVTVTVTVTVKQKGCSVVQYCSKVCSAEGCAVCSAEGCAVFSVACTRSTGPGRGTDGMEAKYMVKSKE